MADNSSLISDAFKAFMTEAPAHQQAWAQGVQQLGQANVLDSKTGALAYLAVLAATGLTTGIPFHVQSAKAAGASRDEVISAVLLGLPAVGNRVIQSLPAALSAYDVE
jgi:alkylhydroperoxidase/carboxymuconolactone decarboxylase family protein YurZ